MDGPHPDVAQKQPGDAKIVTVDDLLAAARVKAATLEQEDVIAFVVAVADQHNIRVRYDAHRADAQQSDDAPQEFSAIAETVCGTVEFASDGATADAEYTCDMIYDDGTGSELSVTSAGSVYTGDAGPPSGPRIETKTATLVFEEYEFRPDGQFVVCRLVLSCDRKIPRTGTPFNTTCNGYVVDARTWRPLAVPPRAFTTDVSQRDVDRMLDRGLVDTIRVDDGTVVTFYSWVHPRDGPIWDLASSNAYSVSSLRWMGPKTYAEIVFEVASMYPEFIEKTGATLVRRGDETRIELTKVAHGKKCYTVGFRHHDFHPMKVDPQRMWQIQSVDLESGAVTYGGELPGIPSQTVLDTAALATRLCAELKLGQATGAGPVPRLKAEHLARFGEGSLEAAKEFVRREMGHPGKDDNRGRAPAGELPPQLHYGFILRAKRQDETAPIDVLVESSLLVKVRQTVYERAPKPVRPHIDHTNRLEYNAVRTFLSQDRHTFEALFPHWKSVFKEYDDRVRDLVAAVYHLARQQLNGSSHANRQTPTQIFAAELLRHIVTHEPRGPAVLDRKTAHSLIRDYVVNPDHAHLLIQLRRSSK
ncbi:MAG: hypothetical protein KGL39_01690 [Patescibacteria group bacterium]|nr:hypothetical protein [Patescibacteria group bacterium]